MPDRIKLFYIVSRFPFPLIKGDKLRAYHQIKGLSKNFDIYLCALSDEKITDESIAALQPFCKEIFIHRLKWTALLLNVLKFFFFSHKPLQTAYFYNNTISQRIEKDINRIKPNHVFCQLIRTALYANHLNSIPKTLDYMDALSAGMERRAENASGIVKKLYSMEANRLKAFEHTIYKDFNNAVIISKSDRSQIFHYDNEAIRIVPNGIDMDFFKELDVKKEFDILFTGNMSYPPNVQSAVYLVEDIMPLVWAKKPDVKLLISGANPTNKIKSLASGLVTIKGWSDDLRTSYSSAQIFVAPMLIGSGLQNKLLEAMAMKMPCISSELANKSLGAIEDESILIGRNEEDYSKKILTLLENNEKAADMAEKGHSFVAHQFKWSTSNELLEEIIRNGKT